MVKLCPIRWFLLACEQTCWLQNYSLVVAALSFPPTEVLFVCWNRIQLCARAVPRHPLVCRQKQDKRRCRQSGTPFKCNHHIQLKYRKRNILPLAYLQIFNITFYKVIWCFPMYKNSLLTCLNSASYKSVNRSFCMVGLLNFVLSEATTQIWPAPSVGSLKDCCEVAGWVSVTEALFCKAFPSQTVTPRKCRLSALPPVWTIERGSQ